jgi:hypothetical protein
MKLINDATDYINKQSAGVQILILILAAIPVTLQVLSFFGIKEASDLLDTIYKLTSIYKSFNVDLKILTWSTINIGITIYAYKKINSKISSSEDAAPQLKNNKK